MDIQVFADLFSLGLTPIPVKWNEQTKLAEVHPEHANNGREIMINDVSLWLDQMNGANGIALKLIPPFGMFDFDQKNTDRKNIFTDWYNIVEANNEDIFKKVCIETTRNGGHHVYIKYKKLHSKVAVARHDSKEVISVYTGSLLSYCYPTPGYNLLHNDFSDIEELTDEEYDILVSAAAYFNDDVDHIPGQSTVALIDYPSEYESTAIKFDHYCTDDVFEYLLNSIDLVPVKKPKYKKKLYLPYLRKGSTAEYSAKAYFTNKRLLIFSGSYTKFPTWHDRTGEGDTRWVLTPTKIIFYRNNRDWTATISEINMLCENNSIDISTPAPKQETQTFDRSLFPYDIFPEKIQQYIFAQRVQHEYIAGGILGAVSAAIGNSAYLNANAGYDVKANIYLAVVAPPGGGKTPAIKKAFSPIEEADSKTHDIYTAQTEDYEKDVAVYEKNKKKSDQEKPKPPTYRQILIKDSTIEMVTHILNANPDGCCVLADELKGFLNRFNQYKSGDEEEKWLEIWSGNSFLNQRISTGVKKVKDPFCSIVGGIQPGVLESMAKDNRNENGFFHRFLFVFPKPQKKLAWERIIIPDHITWGYREMIQTLLSFRGSDKIAYYPTPEADALYQKWFEVKNNKYDKAFDENTQGIITKYQDYCLRFALIIQIMEDGSDRRGSVTRPVMERAIRLMEYFFANMLKAGRLLTPETPLDKLSDQHTKLHDALDQVFSTKTFVTLAADFGIKSSAAKMFLIRNEGKLFTKLAKGEYEKVF
jgi:hypothetical protein